MKILLIQPNCTDAVNVEHVSLQFPLNLGHIAAALRESGHHVRMADFNVQDRRTLPRLLSDHRPDVVGLTAMTSTIYNARDIISETKSIDHGIVTVLGGVHASALPEDTMREIEALDYLIVGEGEQTIVELAECIAGQGDSERVKGTISRKEGDLVRAPPRELIEDIDSVPFPARDLIPMDLYARAHVSRGFSRKYMKIAEIITSRGCPNNCIFCAVNVNYGRLTRFRSVENVVAELTECMDRYGITHFSLNDSTLTLERKRVITLCEFFARNGLTWNCNARVNTVDYDLLQCMAKSGCKKIAFGVESGSPEILKKIRKGITVDQVRQAVGDAKRAGIRYVECDFMIGSHVDETLDDVAATVKLIHELMPDFLALAITCPYPGTELYRLMIERGYLDAHPDWSQLTFFGNLKRYERMTYMTSEQMWELQQKIMKEYYGSVKYILSQFKQIRTVSEAKYFAKLGLLYLKGFILRFRNS